MSEDVAGLLCGAQSGDVSSFEALVRPHQTKLYRLALSITGNAEDAEDVFQETILHAFRSIGKFRGDASFSTWLYRIALNAGRNWIRSQNRASSERFTDKLPVTAGNYTAGPEEVIIDREQSQLIHDALLALPVHYREALILRHYENLSYEQIASVLCIPVGTVRSRLSQGRKHLLDVLATNDIPVTYSRR